MKARWEAYIERWKEAGLLDAGTADRVRAYEQEHEKAGGFRWPTVLVVALGASLLGAGVLLFVAAHWDRLSPAERFGLVLGLVACFHVAGAVLAFRSPVLALGLHAVGTISLGGAIFMTGQIFHLQEHWPAGVMLWAAGAAVGWAVFRDWPHAAFTALLGPVWLGGEWVEAARGWAGEERILAAGIVMLAISYLTVRMQDDQRPVPRTLAWIGGMALIPAAALLVYPLGGRSGLQLPESYWWIGWLTAVVLPLIVAWVARGAAAWMNVIAAAWVALLSFTGTDVRRTQSAGFWPELATYGLLGVGALGLILWGLKEGRRERINLGVAGFALTLVAFYFSNVMDKLERSASLVGLGLLFLLGGWLLEKARRRLVGRLVGSEP